MTMSVNRRIAQSAGIVMASVLASRALGFLRDWTVAHQIGSNAATDAYYTAFTLPDFLNYLVAGGSLSLTFIPVFSKYAAEGREEEGWRIFSTVITVMGLVLVALVILGEAFAPRLVSLIAPGFDPSQKEHVVFLTRLMFPAQICFYLGSILSAVQYAKGQFVIPSLAPIIYNLGIILGGVLLSPRYGITGFSIGVLAGALAGNFLLQIYGAARAGARFVPNFDVFNPGFKLFVKLSLPIMLALSLVFADDWIIRWFGSYLQPASITWMSYAKTLMRVPLGVVGQAIGVASFPVLAQLYSEKKFDEMNRTLNSTLKGTILLLLPIGAITMAISQPLVHLIFFSYPIDLRRPRRDRRNARHFLARHVRLGRAKHSGARILRNTRYPDAGGCGHRTDDSQSPGLLDPRAREPAPGACPREFDRHRGLHARALCFSGPAHGKQRGGRADHFLS